MAFQALRPHCVLLLQHVRLADARHLEAAPHILQDLLTTLQIDWLKADLTPKLGAYLFYPFSQILTVNPALLLKSTPAHQAVLSLSVQCLTRIVARYPLDDGVREQLWIFCALTLGGPLGSQNIDSAWNHDVHISTLGLFREIATVIPASSFQNIPNSIIAHTLNTLLIIAEDMDIDACLASLAVLKVLLKSRLPHRDLVPQFLPGVISTLCKVIIAGKRNSEVCSAASKCVLYAVIGAVSDIRSRKHGLLAGASSPNLAAPPKLEDISDTTLNILEPVYGVDSTTPVSDTTPGKSTAWLQATAGQLHRSLMVVATILCHHDNSRVRFAFAQLCGEVLHRCHRSLQVESVRFLYEQLLIYSTDDWQDVCDEANHALDILQSQNCANLDASQIAVEAVCAVPHTILSHGTSDTQRVHRCLSLASAALSRCHAVTYMELHVERWSRTLLVALRLSPDAHPGHAITLQSSTATPWYQPQLLTFRTSITESHSVATFPHPTFVHLPSGKTFELLRTYIKHLGAALLHASSKSEYNRLIRHFLMIAEASDPCNADTASAIWILTQLCEVLTGHEIRGSDPATSERIVRDLVDVALNVISTDELQEQQKDAQNVAYNASFSGEEFDHADDTTAPQVVKGLSQLNSLLGPDHHVGNSRSSPKISEQQVLRSSQSVSLQLLASAASLLQQGFRAFLLDTIYPVIRMLVDVPGQRTSMTNAYAIITLHNIAVSCDYASTSSMIIDNIDYLLNAITANLRARTGDIDPLAPAVLSSVIDLAGEGVLPYIGDGVDEIFEALDRWHAYDLLVSELLRVLDRVLQIVSSAVSVDKSSVHRTTPPNQPDSQRDLAAFENWFVSRRRNPIKPLLEMDELDAVDVNPQQPFADAKIGSSGHPEDEDSDSEQAGQSAENSQPLNKAETLCLAIMRKATYFLTHSSAFLRARVLNILTVCTDRLKQREAELLPEINRAWPYILSRLDDGFAITPPFVMLECFKFIRALVSAKGEFMNTRIVNDVWPRVVRLLEELPSGTTAAQDHYTTDSRIMRTLLDIIATAIAQVPHIRNNELWQIAIVFRPYLEESMSAEVKQLAIEIYRQMRDVDRDLVWIALQAGIGHIPELAGLSCHYVCGADAALAEILETV